MCDCTTNPLSARSIGEMVDFAIPRAEQGQDLVVERAEAQHKHLDAGCWSGDR
jgi:hypothetical protein